MNLIGYSALDFHCCQGKGHRCYHNFFRYFPESIRWMRVNGKLGEAEELLKSMAKINGKPEPHARLRKESQTHKTATFLHLFYPLQIFVQTVIQALAWLVIP